MCPLGSLSISRQESGVLNGAISSFICSGASTGIFSVSILGWARLIREMPKTQKKTQKDQIIFILLNR
ncbi:MAG: hypothetical protein CMH78_06920 [Nitrospinae bacterium]|nr:hypothetical protein [Nitrospinota bacterium]